MKCLYSPWFALAMVTTTIVAASAEDNWERASANGERNRRFMAACWRYVHGWLQHADPASGLIPRNLGKDLYWNAKDAAADNYPFMVLSCFYTERALFDGRMACSLRTKLTSRLGALPDDYVFATKAFACRASLDDAILARANTQRTDWSL